MGQGEACVHAVRGRAAVGQGSLACGAGQRAPMVNQRRASLAATEMMAPLLSVAVYS